MRGEEKLESGCRLTPALVTPSALTLVTRWAPTPVVPRPSRFPDMQSVWLESILSGLGFCCFFSFPVAGGPGVSRTGEVRQLADPALAAPAEAPAAVRAGGLRKPAPLGGELAWWECETAGLGRGGGRTVAQMHQNPSAKLGFAASCSSSLGFLLHSQGWLSQSPLSRGP